jgi:hypothetical protein
VNTGCVQDVLAECEARGDQARVHGPVDDPVDLAAPQVQQADQERTLECLLGDRCRNHRCGPITTAGTELMLPEPGHRVVDQRRTEH